ncbi:MAG: thymidine phosphorylase [Proteobacteria bacterium]|nr:thymidine phosphorylase [Pseudomonadota bacterium]
MLPQEIIRRKRDGGTLSEAELAFIVRGITDDTLSEGQVAAFAMAVFFEGMSIDECAAFTRLMAGSGHALDWRDARLPGPIIDKHSTGGVGDKASLLVAPILAACGLAVPMISGRGLGHTGGTLDKLDSIPGYDTTPDSDRFRRVVAEVGCAIIGQTVDLAPADRRLYAIRDVTGTVESIPLIASSILAKKLAAGLDGLIMDVKFGNGAFMEQDERALELADSFVSVAKLAGLPTVALLSDMNQVLGGTAGNALEVAEAIAYLKGEWRDPRLHDVTTALAVEALILGGEKDRAAAARAVAQALDSGRAAERFARMAAALGGPRDILEAPARHLPHAAVTHAVAPERPGIVAAVDTRAVGVAVLELGGGRRRPDDTIDHAVGLTDVVGPGDRVGGDRPLAIVHARSADDAEEAAAALRRAYRVGEVTPVARPVVWQRRDGTS